MNEPVEASRRVAVLLSTYNGARFLAEQLDSLAAQAGVAVEVFVRDDGSVDATPDILTGYASRWPHLARVSGGPNLGPAMSFLEVLKGAPDGFDGYAFCDQDDVWLPEKLARACRALAAVPADRPALYCSQVTCVGADLRPLGPAPVKDDGRFEHLLFENIAFGVTVVMNAQAARLVRARPPVSRVIMHDWWCALVVSAFGEVIYDPAPGVLYRQHGGNEIGQGVGALPEMGRKLGKFLRRPSAFWPVRAQAAELLRLWGDDLRPEHRDLAQRFVDSRATLAGRLAFAASGRIVKSSPVAEIFARGLVAAGLY